jgi:DNA gyrase subunit B
MHSFINGRTALFGGWHEDGFKRGLTRAVNEIAGLPSPERPIDDVFLGEDVREGLTVVMWVTMNRLDFGPSGKLESARFRSLVERATYDEVRKWLAAHPADADAVINKAKGAMADRESGRRAWESERRKTGGQLP